MLDVELPQNWQAKPKGFANWFDHKISLTLDDGNDSMKKDANSQVITDDETDSFDDDSEGRTLLPTSVETLDESSKNKIQSIWHKHWLGPDDNHRGWVIHCFGRRVTLLDVAGFKLLKCFLVTIFCLITVHVYAKTVGDKRDETYDLYKLIVYEGRPIAGDIVIFFIVGRLYEAPSMDRLAFVVPLLVTALGQSWGATHLTDLQHSITLQELKCEWTWPMYLLVVGVCLPLLGSLCVAHCKEAVRREIGLRALVELCATGIVCFVPYGVLSDKRFFHLHHWYYAWFLAMHCNLHGKWWSDLAMSVLWGIYINGVAIFGRDPVLSCSLALYESQSQECPYLLEGMGYGVYTLEDLARDSGFGQDASINGGNGIPEESVVCSSDITRWLSAFR